MVWESAGFTDPRTIIWSNFGDQVRPCYDEDIFRASFLWSGLWSSPLLFTFNSLSGSFVGFSFKTFKK